MARARRTLRPPRAASADDMRRRVTRIIGFLPVGIEDLHASAVRCPEDAGTFATTLVDMLADGSVLPDPYETGWFTLPSSHEDA